MEIEAKFAIPDEEAFRRLQVIDQLAGFMLSSPQTKMVHDSYWDTADLAIKKAGYACRKRESNGTILITLKQLAGADGAVHKREEFEVSLARDEPPTQWPDGQARDLLLQFTNHEPMVRLFDLRQVRVVRCMSSPSERTVAELSLDEVRLQVNEREQVYFELEVELLPEGTEHDLAMIQDCLEREWALTPESRSKFERAFTLIQSGETITPAINTPAAQSSPVNADDVTLSALKDQNSAPVSAEENPPVPAAALPAETRRQPAAAAVQPHPRKPPKKPGLKINDTMAEGARKTLYFHFKRMVFHEPGTRLGQDPEELHDMRVATRRMRAAIRVFGEYLDKHEIQRFAKELRRVGRTLGAVRDLDVFRQKTDRYIDTLPPQQQNGLQPLLAVLEGKHQKDREQLLDFLDSDRYVRFKKRFAAFLKKPGAAALPAFSRRGEPLPQRIRHVLPVVLYQQLAAVRAFEELLQGPDLPLELLHRLRIAFKGLRYALEFFREVLGRDSEQLIEEIKTLQDHLGDLQDAVVTGNLLRDYLTCGTWGHGGAAKRVNEYKPVIAPGVVAYLAARQTELQLLLELFPGVWAKVNNQKFVKHIASLVAPL